MHAHLSPRRPPHHPALAKFSGHQVVALLEADIPALQSLYDANPEYSQLVMGRMPLANEARNDFYDLPPPEFPVNKKWMIGLVNDAAINKSGRAKTPCWVKNHTRCG